MSSKFWALLTLGVLLVSLAVVVAFRVPWSTAPSPRADQIAALGELPPEAVARGRAFGAALRPASYAALAIGLLVALGLGLTPAGARLVDFVSRPFGGHWLAQAVLGGLAVVLVGEVVTLPFAVWRRDILRDYGLSTQSWVGWLIDLAKAYALAAVLGGVALGVFFTVTRFLPRWWWAVGAAGAAALTLALTFVFPVLVAPLFNKFTPMEQGALRDSLIQLAERDGVPVKDVLVADASRRTKAVNAYVSGYGATRRIVVYDTLLREAPEAEVRAVVAHELSHAKNNDVFTGSLLGALGSAAAVCVVYLIGAWTPVLRRAGVESIAEPRAVALLVAMAAVGGMLAGPSQALMSRKIEARSDAHALALTNDPRTFQAMMARLATLNIADVDPNRFEYTLFSSHPSILERLAMARAWSKTH